MRSGTLPTPLIVGMGEACRIAAQEMEVGSCRTFAALPHSICSALRVQADHAHVSALSRRLLDGLQGKLEQVGLLLDQPVLTLTFSSQIVLNGHPDKRYPGNLNVSFSFVEGESLLMVLHSLLRVLPLRGLPCRLPPTGFEGGGCVVGKCVHEHYVGGDHDLMAVFCCRNSGLTRLFVQPSYVLRAIGVGEDLAHTSIRFGIGACCLACLASRPLTLGSCAGRFTTQEEIDRAIETTYK